jgi:DNA-binding NarL/FixJ family response regulator
LLEETVDVLVIEDNEMERGYLRALLSQTPGLACAGAYGWGSKALRRLSQDHADVILIALQPLSSAKLDLFRQIRRLAADTPVLLLFHELSARDLFDVLEIGVSGLLQKPCAPDQIVRAITIVSDGGAAMSGGVARRILEYFRARGASVHGLTGREREVLNHLTQGRSPLEIAACLGVSSETIRTHLRNIIAKMHVHSRSEAVAKYLNPTLVEPNHQ